MPTIPSIPPNFETIKSGLVGTFMTKPAQGYIPPPPEVVTPLVTSIAFGIPSALGSDAPTPQILVFVEDVSDAQLANLYNSVSEAVPKDVPFSLLRAGRFVGQQPPPLPAPGRPGSSISTSAPLQ